MKKQFSIYSLFTKVTITLKDQSNHLSTLTDRKKHLKYESPIMKKKSQNTDWRGFPNLMFVSVYVVFIWATLYIQSNKVKMS
jgi:hypothetical protein